MLVSLCCKFKTAQRILMNFIILLADYPGIYLSQSSIRQTHIHPFIYIYNIHIRFLYIHIVICVPSLVEIALGVPEFCLSGVICSFIFLTKFCTNRRHRNVGTLPSCDTAVEVGGSRNYIEMDVCLYVCSSTTHNISGCCLDTNLCRRYLVSDWSPVGGSHGSLPHHPPPAESDASEIYLYIIYT
jgi:hypothetical protein